jgi:hypothetical protein
MYSLCALQVTRRLHAMDASTLVDVSAEARQQQALQKVDRLVLGFQQRAARLASCTERDDAGAASDLY